MKTPQELRVGVVVIKDLEKIREDEQNGIRPGDWQGPPAPLMFVDREEHKRFFKKIMATVR